MTSVLLTDPDQILKACRREAEKRSLTLDDWVWCLHCERVMQVKELRVQRDWIGCRWEEECAGAGFVADLWLLTVAGKIAWQGERGSKPPKHFPAAGKLRSGRRVPLYKEGDDQPIARASRVRT